MAEKSYSDKILIEYLLGTLPEKETERIDELTITDAAMSDRLKSIENELIDGFATGELSDSDHRQFELHYLASPIRQQKVVFARAFQKLGEKSLSSEISSIRGTREVKHKLAIFSGFSPILRWGFAVATLLLVVTAGWLWLGRTGSRDVAVTPTANETDIEQPAPSPVQLEAGSDETAIVTENPETRNVNAPQTHRNRDRQNPKVSVVRTTVATFILAPPIRGVNQVQTITIPPSTTRAAFKLELESNDFAKYRLALREQGTNRVVWQSASVRASRQAAVNANVPANLLQPKIYAFSVTGISGNGTTEIIGDYSFKVAQ